MFDCDAQRDIRIGLTEACHGSRHGSDLVFLCSDTLDELRNLLVEITRRTNLAFNRKCALSCGIAAQLTEITIAQHTGKVKFVHGYLIGKSVAQCLTLQYSTRTLPVWAISHLLVAPRESRAFISFIHI